MGGGWMRSSAWENSQQIVPQINLDFIASEDPAAGMFTSANFPGISNGDLNNARRVYAMLTGRISSIQQVAALDPATGQYVLHGPRRREGRLDVWSGFIQDQWRLKPTVTLSLGARYDLQTPFTPTNDTMAAVTFDSICGISGRGPATTPYNKCNFFSRQANTNVVPEFIKLTSGTRGYETDYNNISPSVSIAWRPNVQTGFMRALLGDPEQATLRAGFSQTYSRQGLGVFTGQYGSNPGSTITVTRSNNNGNLVNAG
jgi:outer membrane receptor protein involved in Fe transport